MASTGGIYHTTDSDGNTDSFVESFVDQKMIAVMNFLAAQPEMNCFKLQNIT